MFNVIACLPNAVGLAMELLLEAHLEPKTLGRTASEPQT